MIPLHKKIELSHNTPKPFPFSQDAEKYVLGALLSEGGSMVQIASFLSPKHFYNERQGNIYTVMLELFRESQPIDILTTFQRCQLRYPKAEFNALELMQYTNDIMSARHIEAHAEIIKNKWSQREIMRIGNKMLYLASAPTQDVKEMLGTFGGELMQLSREAIPDKTETTADTIKNILDEIIQPVNGLKGLETGISKVDDLTEGLEKGDFIVVGARPGMGKTALLVTMAQHQAFNVKNPIAFISYEMTKKRILERVIAMRANINSRDLGKRKLNKDEMSKVNAAADEIYNNPNFHFINGRGLDVIGIRAKAMELKQTKGIKALYIDYLQRIPTPKSMARKSTHDAIGANTQALAELALELDIPVIVPCQLRKPERGAAVKMPSLDHLRDSGKIEDDAVKVWFIHRPEYYGIERFENEDSTKGKAQLICAKNRNGELGVSLINFHAPTTRFHCDEMQSPDFLDSAQDDDFLDVPF